MTKAERYAEQSKAWVAEGPQAPKLLNSQGEEMAYVSPEGNLCLTHGAYRPGDALALAEWIKGVFA